MLGLGLGLGWLGIGLEIWLGLGLGLGLVIAFMQSPELAHICRCDLFSITSRISPRGLFLDVAVGCHSDGRGARLLAAF